MHPVFSMASRIRPRPPAADMRSPSGCAPHARAVLIALSVSMGVVCLAGANDYARYTDAPQDWLARRTDPNGVLPYDIVAHAPVDLLEIWLARWLPDAPETDLFEGYQHASGQFFRLNVTVAGLMNPPGNTRPWAFDPFAYGPNPMYGFVEVDMDGDPDTGGELDAPEARYVSNAVRFGGKPDDPKLADRFALDADAFDNDFETAPFIERSGEEFHLALLGSVFTASDITVVNGDGDLLFEAGETWRITAPWFHRAHGYETFSLALGGATPGSYEPDCTVQFAHDVPSDTTTISLVFPLTNVGAAAMWDEPVEPPNADPSDQFSTFEALKDLNSSAEFLLIFPTGQPEEEIIRDWAHKDPGQYQDPTDWTVSALLGTSYTVTGDTERFIWTDIWPDAIRGDVDGNGLATSSDQLAISNDIALRDADDGIIDGRAPVLGYPAAFSVFDIDDSGVLEPLDEALVSAPGDMDGDSAVGLADLAGFQRCFRGSAVPCTSCECGLADLDTDGDVDIEDWWRLELRWSGSAP